LCCFEVDTVLGPIDFAFRLVPFYSHSYLQSSPYGTVKSMRWGADRQVPQSAPPCRAYVQRQVLPER
jgi:hypothetical protein